MSVATSPPLHSVAASDVKFKEGAEELCNMYVQHVGIEKIREFGVKPLENTESKNLKIGAHSVLLHQQERLWCYGKQIITQQRAFSKSSVVIRHFGVDWSRGTSEIFYDLKSSQSRTAI